MICQPSPDPGLHSAGHQGRVTLNGFSKRYKKDPPTVSTGFSDKEMGRQEERKTNHFLKNTPLKFLT